MSVAPSELSNSPAIGPGPASALTRAAAAPSRYLLGGIALLACLSMAPAIPALVQQWATVNDYDYCFLIAIICCGWFWRVLRIDAHARWQPDRYLLATLVLASGLAYVLWQGHSELGAQMLLPVIIALAIASVTGWSTARALLPPIAYFYFAIPVWDQLLPLLQQLTIFGAQLGMQLARIPVTVDGNQVSIAEGTFQVIYGCAGLRYLVVSLALATLIGVLDRLSPRRMLVFLLLTIVLAVIANWLRVFVIMYSGHVTGMRHYFVTDSHKGLGHGVFAGLLLLIYWLAARLRRGQIKPVTPAASSSAAPASTRGVTTAVIIVLLAFSLLNARASWMPPDNEAPPQLRPIPVLTGDWQGPLPNASVWQPVFVGASDVQQATYESTQGQIAVYLNVYGPQRQGTELVFYRNTVYAPGQWQLVDAALSNSLQASWGAMPLITEQRTDNGDHWMVAQLYVVGGHRTATGVIAQMWYGLSTVTRPDPAGMLALAVQCTASDCAVARRLLAAFWRMHGDRLIATIPEELMDTPG